MDEVDWSAIERSPEFRELSAGRRRFAWTLTAVGLGLGMLYIVLANVARDLMGTEVLGKMSLGFLGGVALVVVLWAMAFAYLRKSDREWGPMEARIREEAGR